jgi:hypothetical protein
MNRQEANKIILKQISALVESSPDLRFQQILQIMNINKTKLIGELPNQQLICEDLFHEESTRTLERINNKQDA